MKVFLVVQIAGPMHGKKILVATPVFTIGRDPKCSLEAGSPTVAEQHCALAVREEKVFVRDLDSAGGTFVNDVRITSEIQLTEGDRLKVGPLLFGIRIETDKKAAPPEAKEPTGAPQPEVALIVQNPGPMQRKKLPIAGPTFTIGRDPQCSLQAGNPAIAEQHCVLEIRAAKVFLRDLETAAGTFVNDARIAAEIQLRDADCLKVGPLLFEISIKPGKKDAPAPDGKISEPKSRSSDNDAAHAAQELWKKYLRGKRQ